MPVFVHRGTHFYQSQQRYVPIYKYEEALTAFFLSSSRPAVEGRLLTELSLNNVQTQEHVAFVLAYTAPQAGILILSLCYPIYSQQAAHSQITSVLSSTRIRPCICGWVVI